MFRATLDSIPSPSRFLLCSGPYQCERVSLASIGNKIKNTLNDLYLLPFFDFHPGCLLSCHLSVSFSVLSADYWHVVPLRLLSVPPLDMASFPASLIPYLFLILSLLLYFYRPHPLRLIVIVFLSLFFFLM